MPTGPWGMKRDSVKISQYFEGSFELALQHVGDSAVVAGRRLAYVVVTRVKETFEAALLRNNKTRLLFGKRIARR